MMPFFWVLAPVVSSVDYNASEKHTVFIFRAEYGNSMFFPKCWNLPTSLQDTETQNIIIILAAVKTSDLIWLIIFIVF
jgi:hypothetical protein